MSDLQVIHSALSSAARRRRADRGLRRMWQGTAAGAAVWLILFALYKVLPLPDSLVLQAWVVILLAAAAGFAAGWLKKPSLAETARWVDREKALQERLSTAIEVSSQQERNDWQHLLISDAAKSLS